MKKDTKRKLRDIRSTVMMLCVMAALLSTASYAWFTMTDSPTVTGLNMTAASTGGLKVGLEANGTFHDAVEVDDKETKVLKPVTTDKTPNNFQTPKYNGNEVVGTANLTDITDYVAHYTYYLKSTATASSSAGDINIGIICGDATENTNTSMGITGGLANLSGSIVRAKISANATDQAVAYAIRVGLVPDGSSTMYIWEPNNDGTIANTTMAVNGLGDPVKPHVSSKKNGEIDNAKSEVKSNANVSGALFQMQAGSTKKIDMYIWLEGKDKECANEIQTGNLEAQIQFTVVD